MRSILPLGLLFSACHFSLVSCLSPDRNRLNHLYELTNGPLWLNHTNWNTTAPICSWFGVECSQGSQTDDTGVTAIVLPSNGLAGRIPHILYEIPTLKALNVKDNALNDPGFVGLTQSSVIETIVLSDNGCTQMNGIGNAPSSLLELHLTQNRLQASFPIELCQLTSLKHLYLSQNQLTGRLPTAFGNMTSLESIFIYGSQLSGPIPSEIGLLTNLQIFTMAQNGFTGTIPTTVEQMSSLRTFSVHSATLSGTLPLFRNVPYIKEVLLHDNQLTGVMSQKFLENAITVDNFVHVSLSNNMLAGSIPIELQRFTFLELDLQGNKIDAIPQELCQLGSWMSGLVEQYGCDAILCPRDTFNADGRQSSDETPCMACDGGTVYLGSTECSGQDTKSALDILVEFYSSLGGSDWVNNDGWDHLDEGFHTGTDVCEFYGVTCNGNNNITEIKLPNNDLIGTIPPSVFEISTLAAFDVSRNAVTFTPDGFQALATNGMVKRLNIAGTHSQNLAGIGNADSLVVLDISNIDFGTFVPSELFRLVKIEKMYARSTGFSGPLPTQIGSLVNLIRLELNNNKLTGGLPTELGLLTELELLDLSENEFVGEIPSEFEDLTRLQILYLHQTAGGLGGKLPAFDVYPDLVELSLASNGFSGTIPSSFMSFVWDKGAPITIDLSYNELVGSIPVELEALDNLTISLQGNQIDYIPPELCAKDKWMNGEVGKLGLCDAILCPDRTWNLYGRASSRQNASCLPCDTNTFYGSVTCGDDKDPSPERTILDSLFKSTGGQYWNSSFFWTEHTTGICFREGVECKDSSSDDNAGVTAIRLPKNGLGGDIPSSIYDLSDLRVVDFSDNEVSLDFNGISRASKLETIQMTNTKLTSLVGIGGAPPSLSELNAAGNQMTGTIPAEIFTVSTLRALLLGSNRFTGTLPSSIAGLSNIFSLDMSSNDLTGHLPSELGLLKRLSVLNLSNNQLSGVISTEFGKLKDLTSLSLAAQRSNNKISGPLYAFNENPVLSSLDLSENAITGTIPSDFLASVSHSQDLTVMLSRNKISGGVPVSLDSFQTLYIELAENKIDTLPSELCDTDNTEWMGGEVGQLETCDAILCPPGTASQFGRQVQSGSLCESCVGGEHDAPYFGAKNCEASRVQSEQAALTALYHLLNGTNWIRQDNWVSETNVCTWYGVTCDSDQAVVALELHSNNLDSKSDVSALVFSLTQLVTLDIRGNNVPLDLQMIPPDSKIVTLKLSSTGLKSLDGIGYARNLQRLDASSNLIAGPLTEELFTLSELQAVYLSYNDLSGTLSTKIGELTKLVNFFVDDNEFSGTIPSHFGLLLDLNNLVLSDCLLSGSIPSELGSLQNLELFSAHRRNKPGPRLNGTLPAFHNAPSLVNLYLDHNDLHGTIPSHFLNTSTAATLVTLSHNRINGTVPGTLDSIPDLNIQLEANFISGFPDAFCDNTHWMNGTLGRVGCDAFLCPPGTANPMGRANDTLGCADCGSPDSAPYYGSTSCEEVPSERAILVRFYQQCGGISWYRNDRWATGARLCDWYGVSCHDDGTVKSINLSANNLVSTPPSEIFKLPRLESLVLSSNPIAFSFKGIQDAQRLTEMRLDSTGLSSVEDIPVQYARGLTDLDMRFNRLQGTFPEALFVLTNLQSLDLANNLLESTLPKEFSSLKRLRTLRLGSNNLSGSLPAFSHTVTLTTIDLSNNRLSGKIPIHLVEKANPTATVFVNLASNELTGDLPVELDRFNDLTLYLRDNKIDDIPSIFCHNHAWNGGDVENFGCSAILCPPGTFNDQGRQSTEDLPCIPCSRDKSPFYGTTSVSCGLYSSTARANVNLAFCIVTILSMATMICWT